ncbi:hypothetical protein EDC04DRAFT_2830547 [Pisolithus marmoratus]|nr:hypothetical protein EDC04DRAFT_2830547 [Pisolithus marmoratus]
MDSFYFPMGITAIMFMTFMSFLLPCNPYYCESLCCQSSTAHIKLRLQEVCSAGFIIRCELYFQVGAGPQRWLDAMETS